MNDDVMPNTGDYYSLREPVDQALERKHEKSLTMSALPIIKQTISHLDERIKFRDSIDSINVSIDKDPLLYQKVSEVNKMVKQALIEERAILEDLLVEYGPK